MKALATFFHLCMKNDKGDLELKQFRRTLLAEMRQWSNFGWVEKLNGRKGAGSERERERERKREREKERERRPM